MFKIEAIQDKEIQNRYAELSGTVAVDGYFAYAMFDVESGEPMGFAQFDISNGEGYILDLREIGGKDDFEAMFILGRQTMNFIDLCGAHFAKARANAGEDQLLRAIGFKLNENGEYCCDMTNLFNGSCHNH